MRKLFSSPRIENVEAVATLLRDAGIEVRISNGRGYRGAIRGNFSYRDHSAGGPQPSVWVIRSEQQPEARRLLREAGLLQELPVRESYLPEPAALAGGDRSPLSARGGGRFRYGMLLAIAVMVALVMVAYRAGRGDGDADGNAAGADRGADGVAAVRGGMPPGSREAGADPATPGMPEIATLPDAAFVIATPPALAAALLRAELSAAGSGRGCLSIDGADPDPVVLQALAVDGLDVAAASACDDGRVEVAVSGYATDGSGSGTVDVRTGDDEPRQVAVRREGRDWILDGER